jgi:hypothetical protein
MGENKYRYNLVSAVAGTAIGVGAGAVAAGTAIGAGAGVVGAIGAGVVGAIGAGAVAATIVTRTEDFMPRNCIIGGISSLVLYSAMVLASEIGHGRGVETKLVPFSVGPDQGIVIQRGDGSQRLYVLNGETYVLFDDLSRKDLSSKLKEGQKIRDDLEGNYRDRRNAILESIKGEQK